VERKSGGEESKGGVERDSLSFRGTLTPLQFDMRRDALKRHDVT
jgi:hypothetical protein